MPLLNRQRQPSRYEKEGMNLNALTFLKQWDRLKVQNGLLYSLSKDSKQNRLQLVLPKKPLKKGLTWYTWYITVHQGQTSTLGLAQQCLFWPKMEHYVREYDKHYQQCILAKTPEPSARALLKIIITSAPMESVC